VKIFNSLDTATFISSYKITDFKSWETGSYVKIEIELCDGTTLNTREYNDEKERNYSFHWQDIEGNLIMRWDNAPHHKWLKTYPHHRHNGTDIEESMEISLEEILKYIEKQLKQP
jgi:hypothetical protein